MRPKPAEKPKTRKKAKLRFLLSYLKDERDAFVSMFLINNRANCINTDVVMILSQPLSYDNREMQELGVVPEMTYEEN